jgi:hypothetical protein
MINKKLLLSLIVFSILMVFTSAIKTQTRIIEKNISIFEKKISILKTDIYESQLDYYYLSSPEYISKKIKTYGNQEYSTIDFSRIYFGMDQFLDEKAKTTKKFKHEKKVKKR